MGGEGRDWTRKHAESHSRIIYSARTCVWVCTCVCMWTVRKCTRHKSTGRDRSSEVSCCSSEPQISSVWPPAFFLIFRLFISLLVPFFFLSLFPMPPHSSESPHSQFHSQFLLWAHICIPIITMSDISNIKWFSILESWLIFSFISRSVVAARVCPWVCSSGD